MSVTSDYSTKVDWNRRLMMEPDIWPEGVKITSGFVMTHGYIVQNVNDGLQSSSTWAIYQVPLKGANYVIPSVSRSEYMFYANEDLTAFKPYASSNLNGQVAPSWAKYFIYSARPNSSATSWSSINSMTFCSLPFPPENWVSGQKYSVVCDEIIGSSYRKMSRYAPCRGAYSVTRSSPHRGSCQWFDENKQKISETDIGTTTTWEVPKGAYYFKIYKQSGGTITSGSFNDTDIVIISA